MSRKKRTPDHEAPATPRVVAASSPAPAAAARRAAFAAIPPIGIALALSATLHAAVLSIHFTFPPKERADRGTSALQVVLVNAKSPTRPHKADALAQANLEGGGNTDQKLRASSPLPALGSEDPRPELKARQQKVEALEQEAARLLAQVHNRNTLPTPARQDVPSEHTQATPGADLITQSLQLARLQAQIEKDYQAYQERPKRRFVGARTEEYRFAQYVEDWRIKVEKVGNLNYPEEARRRKIYGSLLLTVHIRPDGSVEHIDVDRSSGSRILDDAAVRIVRLAAPFAPFPENIRKDTDILAITRTWTFTREDQLTSQ